MPLSSVIGEIPYRLALAGGWIDQPFVSRLNPSPPGSMVVVSLEPSVRYMDRCGIAAGTRKVAAALWGGRLPDGDPAGLMRQLYRAENRSKAEPSGSQDMAGLIYPGISRLDYDADCEGGTFPAHIESCCDPMTARWLEGVLGLIPINQRPAGYNPLGVKNLDPEWIVRLGASGRECYEAILAHDLAALGRSMNCCMECWSALLPHTVAHPTIDVDLQRLLACYQEEYAGAMYSGCGGGYLIVAGIRPAPGALRITVRTGS